ncbi:MAG: hypothetical protein WD648_14285 [Planctomycetaceae bacterium]
MPASTFSCPHCDAPLRAKDARLAGRTVECPDCRRPLKIVADASRQLTVQAAPTSEKGTTSFAKGGVGAVAKAAKSIRRRTARWQEVLSNPLVVAWAAGGVLTFMLLIALWPRRDYAARDSADNAVARQAESSDKNTGDSDEEPAAKANDASKSAPLAMNELPVEAPKPVALVENNPPAEQIAIAEPAVAEKPPIASEPAVEPPPQPAPPIDVAANLAQPIVRFEQIRPVPFRDLLLLVEEMAGVPIVYDQIDPAAMQTAFDTRVSLSLQRTTVGEILQETLKRVGLSFDVEPGIIRLSLARNNQPAAAGRSPK